MKPDNKPVDTQARNEPTDMGEEPDNTTFLLEEGLPLLSAFRVIDPETRASLFQLIQRIARKDTHLAS